MKKIALILLVLAMALSMVACGNNNNADNGENNAVVDDTNNNENNVEETPAESLAALDVLNAAWEKYSDDEKVYFMGGDYDAFAEGPGVFNHENAEYLAGLLIVPADAVQYIDEAASLFHSMNFNNFTCGSYVIADSANVDTFVSLMNDAIMNNQWMCGFPEVLSVVKVGENNVVITFGNSDLVNLIETRLVEVYPDAVVTQEPIV